MKSHLSILFLRFDSPPQFIVRGMRILLQIHDITDVIHMVHNVISCGGTGKHGYTLQSVWLNERYEITSRRM